MIWRIASKGCFVFCQTLSSFITLCYFVLIWNILFYSWWIFWVIIVSFPPNFVSFCASLFFFVLVNFCIASFIEVVVLYICHCSFCRGFFLCFFIFNFHVSYTSLCPILLHLFFHSSCACVSIDSYLSNIFFLSLQSLISWSSPLYGSIQKKCPHIFSDFWLPWPLSTHFHISLTLILLSLRTQSLNKILNLSAKICLVISISTIPPNIKTPRKYVTRLNIS